MKPLALRGHRIFGRDPIAFEVLNQIPTLFCPLLALCNRGPATSEGWAQPTGLEYGTCTWW